MFTTRPLRRNEWIPRRGRECHRSQRVDTQQPLGLRHGVGAERLVPRNAGVVHQRIETSTDFERSRHDLAGIVDDITGSRGGVPSGRDDLSDDGFGDVAIKIVHDDVRAPLREQQRVRAADAAPGAADEHDLIVEADGVCSHVRSLSRAPPRP